MQNIDNSKPLNVVHCIFSLQTGGAEIMLIDIINTQIERGLNVSLIIVNNLIEESLASKIVKEVNVIRMNRTPGSNPIQLMWNLNRIIYSIKPDIIHVHNHKLCPLIRIRRNRLLMTVHDVNIPMTYTRNVRMAAITNAVKEYILGIHPNAKVTTILNGIRTKDILARGTDTTPSIFKLIQVARLDARKKGQDILIKAIAALKQRGVTNIEATFIGDGSDLEMLQSMAKSFGVDKQIRFLGKCDRKYIYAHLKDYDAMCHPARWEGFGLTIAEAMAAGLPLLLTYGDGPWEVADNGRLSLSFPIDNHEECANAIYNLISDYSTALRRAAEGRKFVERYDISKTVENYTKLYECIAH